MLSAIFSVVLVGVVAGILNVTGAWDPLVSLVLGGSGSGSNLRAAWSVSATGRVLVAQTGALSLMTLPDRKSREIVGAANRSVVTSARWRPDGGAIAYAYVTWTQGAPAPRSDIYLTDLTGEARLLIPASGPGELFESPAWSPDGTSMCAATTVTENKRPVQRLERFDLASGARTALGEGQSPDVSPDGSLIAAVRYVDIDPILVPLRPDGTLARTLVDRGRFTLIGSPRFSPDGREIAVALAAPPTQAREAAPPAPWAVLGAPFAEAHGNPSEIYLIDVEGGQPRRLTTVTEDEPAVAWSPDGSMMAVYATRGLYLLDRQGKTTLATNTGGYGALDWSR